MSASRLLAAVRSTIRELRADYERARRLAEHGADAKQNFQRRLDAALVVSRGLPAFTADTEAEPMPEANPCSVVVVIALAGLR
jgi:hypothetical protein